MPYIPKEMRPEFDKAIILVEESLGKAAEKIISEAEKYSFDAVSGCLNYVFTQLFRKVDDFVEVSIIIDLVLNTLFWEKPKYYRFEKVKGLLGCMMDEYTRRGWRRRREVIKILKSLLRRNEYYLSIHEDKAIKRNGDLE